MTDVKQIEQGVFTYDVKNGLGLIDYNVDAHEHAHIIVDTEKCDTCNHMMCVWGCPAQCYNFRDQGLESMKFVYEDCVECGTCFIMCTEGAVEWNHPRGGFGITYNQG